MTFAFNENSITPSVDGGGGGTVIETLSPSNTAGLCLWLDAEINSREGIHDETINGMQNLVYTPYVGKSSSVGCLEKLNGTPTFTNNSCRLGGTMFAPSFDLSALTFEFTGSFISNVFDNVISQQLLINHIIVGGFQTMFTSNAYHYQVYNATSARTKQLQYALNIEPGKVYHIALTDVLGKAGTTKLYIDGEFVETTLITDSDGGVCPTATDIRNMGIMGVNSTSTTSIYPVEKNTQGAFYGEYTNINTMRLWNRVLSVDEIKNNYENDKRRFG